MSEDNKGDGLDHTRAALMWIIFLLFVLFWGQPDLHESLIHYLIVGSKECNCSE